MRKTITTTALASMVLCAVAAMAALTPEQRCEAGKDDAAGKYAACIAKAEKTFVLSGDSDRHAAAVNKCDTKLAATWDKLEAAAAAAGTTCPSAEDLSPIANFVDACMQSVAAEIGGGPLGLDPVTCNTDLGTCTGTLGTCNGSLGTCNNSLWICNGDLGACNGSLTTCNANYTTCSGALGTCNAGTALSADVLTGKTFSSAAGLGVTGTMANRGAVTLTPTTSDQAVAAGYHNGSGKCAGDADLAASNIASGVNIFGVTGTALPAQLLKTGQTTSYGTGSDGDLEKGVSRSFTDNGDGTITDNATGLMWEKKSDDNGIHDKDTMYTWGMASSPYTMDGTMVTTFVAALNTGPCFAGYCDWRIPNLRELQSLQNSETYSPAAYPAFNTGCVPGCTVTTCSCTFSDYFWSSSTCQIAPSAAWAVGFNNGYTFPATKTNVYGVRAVRAGS